MSIPEIPEGSILLAYADKMVIHGLNHRKLEGAADKGRV